MADLSGRAAEDSPRDEGLEGLSGDLKSKLTENERIERLIIQPWLDAARDRGLRPDQDGAMSVLFDGIRAAITEAKNVAIIGRMALSEAKKAELDTWLIEQNHKTLMAQRERGSTRSHAYHGAIGGSLTWESTPTTLGTTIRVVYRKGTPQEAMIDLTDYSDW